MAYSWERVRLDRGSGKPSQVLKSLNELLGDYKNKPKTISGGIYAEDGFERWWYLEWGTATGAKNVDKSTPLQRPTGVRSGRSRKWYKIRAKHAPWLVYEQDGILKFRKVVSHPGIRPANRGYGIVRVAIRHAQKDVKKQLDKWKHERHIPKRSELVNLINMVLGKTVAEIQERTPLGEGEDGHLRDAWKVRPAS